MRQRVFTWAQGTVLGGLFGFAAIGCLCTAFSLPMVDLSLMAVLCMLTGILAGFCYCFRLSLVPLGALAMTSGFLWQSGFLEDGAEALLFRITTVYHGGYNWEVIRWSSRSVAQMDASLPEFVYFLAILMTLITVWTVCRGKTSLLACLCSIVPVFACFVVTDTLPELWLLFVYLAVFFILMFTSHSRQQDTRQANRLTLLISLPVVLVLGILFMAVPESEYRGQQQARALCETLFGESPLDQMWDQVTGQAVYTGNSVDGSTVDLTRIGIRVESDAEVMRVNSGYTGTLYLRGRALDGYSGTQWYDTRTKWDLEWPATAEMNYIGGVVITTKYAHRMMYVPYYNRNPGPEGLYRGMENEEKLSMYSFSTCKPPEENYLRTRYRAWKTVYNTLSEEARGQMQESLEQCTELPADTQMWAQKLVKEIIGEETNHYEIVQRIGSYVRNSADYDLQTKRMPGRQNDFARWFLESGDTGYCVHFATAATVLLKAAGIPARYVTGYLVEVQDGKTAVVRGKQAHAWTEYYLPGFGWAILEATPSVNAEQAPEQTVPPAPGDEQTRPSDPTPTVPAQDPEHTLPKPDIPGEQELAPNQGQKTDLTLLWVILGVLAAVAAVMGQWRLRLWLRRKKFDRGGINAQALARWQDAAWLCRVMGATPPKELFELAQKAKFSQYTITPEELAQFVFFRKDAVRQLKKRNIFRRLWYRIILAIY